jgi:hypothetical protein
MGDDLVGQQHNYAGALHSRLRSSPGPERVAALADRARVRLHAAAWIRSRVDAVGTQASRSTGLLLPVQVLAT